MYQNIKPFQPLSASTPITVAITTAANALPRSNTKGTGVIRVMNDGANVTYFTLGDATVTTTVATGIALLPNSVETFFVVDGQTHIATIGGVAGNTLRVSWGESA